MLPKLSRFARMAIAALLLFGAIAIFIRENWVIEVVNVDITIDILPPEFDGFTIGQLTDLHGRKLNCNWVRKQLSGAGVDIITLTGDYVRRDVHDMEGLEPLLALLPEIAPTYAVNGNHDWAAGWDKIAAILQKHGIRVLEDEYVTLQRGDAQLLLSGVSYPYSSTADLAAALPSSQWPLVLLTHSPQIFADYPSNMLMGWQERELWGELLARPNLTLVGHTHGGQIKLPFIGAVTTASGELFPRRHVQGLSREAGGWLYISRGLGYTGIPLRFLSRPELTIVTLRKAK
ncbi:MAG: hypothetical protein GX060_00310 [Firmicutes bacterium]|nr:hypothetical protein [Bacillota bacterium]